MGEATDFLGTGEFPAGTLGTGAEVFVFGEDAGIRMGGFVAHVHGVGGEECSGDVY